MQSNDKSIRQSKPGSKLLSLFIIAAIITGIYGYMAKQGNNSSATGDASENARTSAPAYSQIEKETGEISFNDFFLALGNEQQPAVGENSANDVSVVNHELSTEGGSYQNEDEIAQANSGLLKAKIQQVQKETEYQQLITYFNKVKGDDKMLLLQRLWQLAPELGIDENLLTLLQLATLDPDAHVEKIAIEILSDLQRLRDGVIRPEEQLLSQIMEVSNKPLSLAGSTGSDELQKLDQLELNKNSSALSAEMDQKRNEKIDQLTKLALASENINTKEYALMNLMQLDHESSLGVIQHQLLNSKNSQERFTALERLRSSIGDYDSDRIRPITQTRRRVYSKRFVT